MKSELLEDGRWQHTFRQSSINESTICLERARRTMTGEMPDIETDAACVGTAVHAAIETDLRHYRDTREHFDQETLVEVFEREYADLEALPEFRYVKYTPNQARSLGATFTRHWYQEIRPSLRPIEIELEFALPLWEDEQRKIMLTGTIDLIDERQGITDWKTSGSGRPNKGPYREYEYRKSAVQPTVYTWAASQLGYADMADRFTYCVLHEYGIQQFEVERGPADWQWLIDRCLALSTLMEAQLSVWPKTGDVHVLCSAKWCGAYADCRGKYL